MKYQVWDLESKSLVSPGTLLKLLSERAGIGRNTWHEKAQALTNRSLGSTSKLSDIFADRRPLPLRDIVPLMSVLPIQSSHKQHYTAELFKAYTDKSLRSFINSDTSEEIIEELRTALQENEDNYIAQFEELSYLEQIKIPAIQKRLDSLTNFDVMNELELAGENQDKDHYPKNISLELAFNAKELLADSIKEICDKDKVQFDAYRFLSYLLNPNYVESLRTFGKGFGENCFNYRWISLLPKSVSISKLEISLFCFWAKSNPNDFEALLNCLEYAEKQDFFSRGIMLHEIERVSIGPFFSTIIKKFQRNFPATYEYFIRYSPSFSRFVKDNSGRLSKIYKSYCAMALQSGSHAETIKKGATMRVPLNARFRRSALNCFFNYVFTQAGDIESVYFIDSKSKKKQSLLKAVSQQVQAGKSFSELAGFTEQIIAKHSPSRTETLTAMDTARDTAMERLSELLNTKEDLLAPKDSDEFSELLGRFSSKSPAQLQM